MPDQTENELVVPEATSVNPLGTSVDPNAADVNDPDGTGTPAATSQPTSDTNPPNPVPLDDEDPFAAAIEAARRAEREALTADLTTQIRAELESRAAADREARRAEEEAERARNAFADTVKQIHSGLRGVAFKDDEGREYKLTDEQIEALAIKPLQTYNSNAQSAVQLQVLTQLAAAAVSSLPANLRDEFNRKAASKPLNEWLQIYAETFAPHTKTVQDLKREEEVKIKAAEARGMSKGQKMPAGTPSQIADQPSQIGNYDLSSAEGVASAQAAGYFKSDAEFFKAWKQATTGRSF